jgi:hypothetical protein
MQTSSSVFKLLFLVAIFGIISSCSKDDDNLTYDLTGSWKVISFVEDNGQRITKSEQNTWMDINNGDITINFEGIDSNGEGVFTGINVSNGYSGNYVIKESGKITIGPIATTFINHPDWAKLFKINDAERYEIENSNLIIYRKNNGGSITLVRT